MKRFLKVVLFVTAPVWIFLLLPVMFVVMLWEEVSEIVDGW